MPFRQGHYLSWIHDKIASDNQLVTPRNGKANQHHNRNTTVAAYLPRKSGETHQKIVPIDLIVSSSSSSPPPSPSHHQPQLMKWPVVGTHYSCVWWPGRHFCPLERQPAVTIHRVVGICCAIMGQVKSRRCDGEGNTKGGWWWRAVSSVELTFCITDDDEWWWWGRTRCKEGSGRLGNNGLMMTTVKKITDSIIECFRNEIT